MAEINCVGGLLKFNISTAPLRIGQNCVQKYYCCFRIVFRYHVELMLYLIMFSSRVMIAMFETIACAISIAL